MNKEQFLQCLANLHSVEIELRTNAERAVRDLEKSDINLYNALIIEAMQEGETLSTSLAGILLKKQLRKNKVDQASYEKIFGVVIGIMKKHHKNLFAQHVIIASLVCNQLRRNDDTIYNKFMALFEDPNHIHLALVVAGLLFEDYYGDITESFEEENSARLQLVFDKLLKIVRLQSAESEFSHPKELFRALRSALQNAEYLTSDEVRSFVIDASLGLLDKGISYGFEILSSCLREIYEYLEPYMERIINSIKLTGKENDIDEYDGVERLLLLKDFWISLGEYEIARQKQTEEFSDFGISAPTRYLGLLQRYGERILKELLQLDSLEEYNDDVGTFFHYDCIGMIATAFNVLPKWDDASSYDYILLKSKFNLTSNYEMIKLEVDTFYECKYEVDLRLPPAYLMEVLRNSTSTPTIDAIVAGAGEFLPMYEKQVQEKCIEFVLDPKGSEEQVKSMAEILRLRLANQSVTKLMGALRDMSNEDLTDAEFNCYKNLGQLYELPEDTLKAFIKRCLSLGRTDANAVYHLVKQISSTRLEKFQEEIYESAIKNELEGVRRSPDILSSLNYKDSTSLLALLAQKLGSKISKEIYHDFLSKRDSLTTSYYTFDAMANIVPTEGISFLTHLETIIDLTEKSIKKADNVLIECAIQSFTTLFQTFKKSNNEFLFVGQIKRIIGAVQPVIQSDPSNETMRAYLIFIKELCLLEHAPNMIRSENMDNFLKSASESSDRYLRNLAQLVSKLLLSS